jgi:predicted Zn-dependent protease
MNIQRFSMRLSTFSLFPLIMSGVLSGLSMSSVASQEWTVPNDNELVATWSQEELKPQVHSQAQSLIEVRHNFEKAGLPGQSWRYDHIYTLMKNITVTNETSEATSDEIKYYRARLMQHSHNFYAAEHLLREVKTNSRYFSTATLMLAQVLVEQERYQDANSVCLRLLLQNPDIAAGCAAATHPEMTESLQTLLQTIAERSDNDILNSWLMYQSVSGYVREGQPEKALSSYLQWYGNNSVSELTVADLSIIADAYIEMNQPHEVIELLSNKISTKFPDDALVIQLARAEKHINSTNITGSRQWQSYATLRMEERIRRNDVSYGELISVYYAELKNDSRSAKVWSEKYRRKIHQDRALSGVTAEVKSTLDVSQKVDDSDVSFLGFLSYSLSTTE